MIGRVNVRGLCYIDTSIVIQCQWAYHFNPGPRQTVISVLKWDPDLSQLSVIPHKNRCQYRLVRHRKKNDSWEGGSSDSMFTHTMRVRIGPTAVKSSTASSMPCGLAHV